MRKGCIGNVIIHIPDQYDADVMAERINKFYIEIAERKIKNSGLPKEDQIEVIDRIMEKMKAKEGVF